MAEVSSARGSLLTVITIWQQRWGLDLLSLSLYVYFCDSDGSTNALVSLSTNTLHLKVNKLFWAHIHLQYQIATPWELWPVSVLLPCWNSNNRAKGSRGGTIEEERTCGLFLVINKFLYFYSLMRTWWHVEEMESKCSNQARISWSCEKTVGHGSHVHTHTHTHHM